MNRHDLAYLKPHVKVQFLENALAQVAKDKLYDLLTNKVPLTVCRQDQLDTGKVKLAMTCFVGMQKYRIALLVDSSEILKITTPVSLAQLVISLPSNDKEIICGFLNELQRFNCDVYVYGSYAYQYLTQDSYVNSQSDLDLVFYPRDLKYLSNILFLIQKLSLNTNLKIDGEIKIHPDWHVSFHELIKILHKDEEKIIVKGLANIGLMRLTEILCSEKIIRNELCKQHF